MTKSKNVLLVAGGLLLLLFLKGWKTKYWNTLEVRSQIKLELQDLFHFVQNSPKLFLTNTLYWDVLYTCSSVASYAAHNWGFLCFIFPAGLDIQTVKHISSAGAQTVQEVAASEMSCQWKWDWDWTKYSSVRFSFSGLLIKCSILCRSTFTHIKWFSRGGVLYASHQRALIESLQ